MTLSEMRGVLEQQGIRLTKSLGQSFLHDGNQLGRIIAAANLQPADRVLEIGPGLGPLTERLVAVPNQVLAIEVDRRLVELLRQRFATTANLTIVHADALKYLTSEPRDWHGWKLVANLPYSVASPILVELASMVKRPDLIVVTVQLEVARRLMARAGDRDYGLLTILVQLGYEPGRWFKIPAACFFPQPDIDSACLILRRRESELLTPPELAACHRLVKRSFSQRRKMMLKLLKADFAEAALHSAFERVGLSVKVRAEEISPDQFVQLNRALHPNERRNL